MKTKQYRWAIIHQGGHINHGFMRFTRRDVIDDVIKEFRGYRSASLLSHLSDAQFWRVIKRKRGWSVRRVELRIVR